MSHNPAGNGNDGGEPQSGSRILSVEELSQPQKALLDRYMRLCKEAGVAIGAMIGRATWDIRPLILFEGNLALLRVGRIPHPLRGQFTQSYSSHAAMPAVDTVLDKGQEGDEFWILRKYFDSTLLDDHSLISDSQELDFVLEQLVVKLEHLQQANMVHGHLSLPNLAIEAEKLYLLDACLATYFFGYESKPPGLAPELAAGERPQKASDIFGLGKVLENFLEIRPDLSALTARMLSSKPSERPSLREIRNHLWPTRPGTKDSGRGSSAAPKIIGKSSLKPGKLINPTAIWKEGYVPEKSEEMGREAAKSPLAIPSKVKQPAPPSKRSVSSYLNLSNVLGSASLLFLLLLGFFIWNTRERELSSQEIAYYQSYWTSGQASLMQEVARKAATSSDRHAEAAIIQDVLSGNVPSGVHAPIIRAAFNPLWESELSRRDRQMIFRLSLSPLLPEDLKKADNLASAHPAVILAVAGNSGLQGEWEELSRVSTSTMASLKDPYGLAFQTLLETGVESMEDTRARALSRILVGDRSPRTVSVYLDANDPSRDGGTARLRTLVYLNSHFDDLLPAVKSTLRNSQNILGERFRWFESEKVADWSEISDMEVLLMTAGMLPEKEYGIENYADLLKFPSYAVREAAEEMLIKHHVEEALAQLVRFLASEFNMLSRYQTVSLLLGLMLGGDAAHPFISAWFGTGPNPQTVLNILALNSSGESHDLFSLEAARYLKEKDWQATVGQLRSLASNKEPLVRALAYTRLNPGIESHMRIMEERIEREEIDRLRTELKMRVGQLIPQPQRR